MTTLKVLVAGLFVCCSSVLFMKLDKLESPAKQPLAQELPQIKLKFKSGVVFVCRNAVDAAVVGASITLTGSKGMEGAFSKTITTNVYGSAFFAGLAPGIYKYEFVYKQRFRAVRTGYVIVPRFKIEKVGINIAGVPVNERMD
jgi:hypothetical protein